MLSLRRFKTGGRPGRELRTNWRWTSRKATRSGPEVMSAAAGDERTSEAPDVAPVDERGDADPGRPGGRHTKHSGRPREFSWHRDVRCALTYTW